MNRNELGGVLPVVQTPFDAAGRIDPDSLAGEVDWVFSQGADGVVVGMVSEILRLTDTERRQVATIVYEAAADRGPLVVSVTAESTVVATDLAVHAAELGATAVMVAPPLTAGGVGEAELARYFDGILSQIDIPVVVQDPSGYVGHRLSIDLQARLFETWGPRVAFKPEARPIGMTIGALAERCGPKASIFEGMGGGALVESYERGVVGSMPAADVCWAVVAAWRALQAGDVNRAHEIVEPMGSLLALESSLDAFVVIEKHLLTRQGVIPEPFCRGPLDFVADRAILAEIDRRFERLVTAAAGPARPARPDAEGSAGPEAP